MWDFAQFANYRFQHCLLEHTLIAFDESSPRHGCQRGRAPRKLGKRDESSRKYQESHLPFRRFAGVDVCQRRTLYLSLAWLGFDGVCIG
jgi:hypothetical protein